MEDDSLRSDTWIFRIRPDGHLTSTDHHSFAPSFAWMMEGLTRAASFHLQGVRYVDFLAMKD